MKCYICGVVLNGVNTSRRAWIASSSEFIPGKKYICDSCDIKTKKILSKPHNNFKVKLGQDHEKGE